MRTGDRERKPSSPRSGQVKEAGRGRGMRIVVPLHGGGPRPVRPRARLPHPLCALLLPPALHQAQPPAVVASAGIPHSGVPRHTLRHRGRGCLQDPLHPLAGHHLPARLPASPLRRPRACRGRGLPLLRRPPMLRRRPIPPGLQPLRHHPARPRREPLIARLGQAVDGGARGAGAPGGDDEDRDLTIRGLATYQPYDGILTLKMVEALSRCSGLPREKATLKSIDYQVRLRKSFMELLMDYTSGKTTLRCVAPITKGQLYSQITWVKQHQV